MANETFDLNSVNQGILNLHKMSFDERKSFLIKVKNYADNHDDPLLLELVEEIMNPSKGISKDLKVIGVDKSTLIPVIVDKDDNTTINEYIIEDNNISGLQLLTKKSR